MVGRPQPPRAYLGDLMALLGAFEGAIDFDRIFAGAGRVRLSVFVDI